MERQIVTISPATRSPSQTIRSASQFAALALLLLAACALADAPATRDPDAYFFTLTFGDLREEAQQAREDGKLGMLLFFKADACPYCQHMLHKVLNRPAVQNWYRERFTSIAVDIHGDVQLTDFDGITLPSKVFSEHRQVFATPVIAFIDFDGNEIYRHMGMVRTPEEMLLIGEYIEGKHYYDTEYRTFAREHGMQAGGIRATPGGETE
jgi:thioredoxin-related protein